MKTVITFRTEQPITQEAAKDLWAEFSVFRTMNGGKREYQVEVDAPSTGGAGEVIAESALVYRVVRDLLLHRHQIGGMQVAAIHCAKNLDAPSTHGSNAHIDQETTELL